MHSEPRRKRPDVHEEQIVFVVHVRHGVKHY